MTDAPIDCTAVVRILWDYLDGELPEGEMLRVADHLRGCLRCRSHAEFEEALLRRIAETRQEATDLAGLERRVRAALAASAP